MALDDKRVSGKRIVEGAPIVLSETNEDLIWMSPKNVLIKKDGQFTFDKYLNNNPFKLVDGELIGGGELDDPNKDTVQLTDIESIVYEPYYLTPGELKYRAILKIRNSSKSKEDVIGVDGRTANLEAQG